MDLTGVYTHKMATDAYRGAGRPEATYLIERLMDLVANELGIDVPSEPSPTQQWELRVVQTFSGSEFDRWYSDLEVQDHKQDIQEAQDEVDKGCNDQIKSLAQTKPSPDIIILALTPEIVNDAHAVQVTGNFFLNFRRAINHSNGSATRWGRTPRLLTVLVR